MSSKKRKWRMVKLKEVIIIDKKPILPNDINNEYYIGLEDINKETGVINTLRCANECDIKSNKFKFTSEHILYGKLRPNLNKVAVPNFNGVCSTDIYPIFTRKEKVFKRYVYHILHGHTFVQYASSRTNGANLPRVDEKIITDYEIPLPPLETQKQIAKTLDTVAELLAMRKQQLADLDNLIKSTFYDMFGDPAINERGWATGIIKDLAIKIQYGTSKKASSEKLPYPILRMNNITYQGDMDFSDMKYIDLNEKDKEKYLVHKGEMLFNRTNSKELVGKTAVYRKEMPMAYAGYLVRLVPNERANSEFISAFLNSTYGKKLLFKMAKNIVGMANINANELGQIEIFIPPISLQTQFASIVTKIEEQKALVKKAIDETQYLFDSLMSQYFD